MADAQEHAPTGDQLRQQATSGMAWSMLQAWGGRLLSTIVFVILGRLLAPEDFGIVALAAALIEVGSLLTVSGFHRVIVQRSDLTRDHLDASFWASTAIGATITAIVWISAPLLADAFGEDQFTPVMRAMSFSFLIAAVGSTPAAILHRDMAFRTFAIRQFVAIASGGIAGVAAALAGAGVWALVAQALVSPAVGLVVVVVSVRFRPRMRLPLGALRELSGFGAKVLASDMLGLAMRRADDLIIGFYLGSTALGFYTIAYRTYAILLEVIIHSVSAVAFPVFSRMAHDQERMARTVVTAARLGAVTMVPAFVGIAVLAPELLVVVFGEQWRPSVPVLRILSVAALMTSVTFFVKEVLIAVGKPNWELVRAATSATAVVVGFRVGVEWGIVGVAWAKLVHDAVLGPVGIEMVRRLVTFRWSTVLRQLVAPVTSALVMGGVVYGASTAIGGGYSVPWLLALCALGLVVYSGLMFLVARPMVDEVLSYATPITRRIRRR